MRKRFTVAVRLCCDEDDEVYGGEEGFRMVLDSVAAGFSMEVNGFERLLGFFRE